MTKETYNKTVDLLLDAYNQEKLFHGICDACAVGNILQTSAWNYDFMTFDTGEQRRADFISPKLIHFLGILDEDAQISKLSPKDNQKIREYLDNLYESNGFTLKELKEIEYTFEMAISEDRINLKAKTCGQKKGQYLGLVAVLNLMQTMVEEPTISKIEELNTIAKKFEVILN